jgi:predicted phosphoadenosine phosphosulfate sulfurtransferase
MIFEFLSNLKTEFMKKSLLLVFMTIGAFTTYYVAYKNGENSAALSCNLYQEKSLKKVKKQMNVFKEDWENTYYEKQNEIQNEIDSYPPYLSSSANGLFS